MVAHRLEHRFLRQNVGDSNLNVEVPRIIADALSAILGLKLEPILPEP